MALLANRRSMMTLYSDPIGASSHAVRFVLAEKAIKVEIHQVEGDERPEDLLDLNPYNAVLTLVDRELVLYEPQIIMEYLDERFPHPPLMPVDPVTRARNRLYRYRIQRDICDLALALEGAKDKEATALRKELRDQLTAIAPIFSQTPYFMSEDYSLVDCLLGPVLWRLPHLGVSLPAEADSVLEYAERLFERPAFRSSVSIDEAEMREEYGLELD